MKLSEIRKQMTAIFLAGKEYEKVKEDGYTNFSYPKFPKLMKFNTERYKVPGFGNFMTMHTKMIFGMELLTTSFMPGEGVSVPYCLIDIMVAGNKRTVFIEYYDCRAEKTEMERLIVVADRFANLVEYVERPKWYVGERTPYSLIKRGEAADDLKLLDMIINSVEEYRKEADNAGVDEANIAGLKKFRERMINEGNPSSSVLEKVFGKEGAKKFFTTCVMPIDE
ncbi:MAG: hypothetical protein J5749_04445 [Lachnospiraceae bacterium]|nr:hypothetical protein [Lachnospiraceae bacterium]